MNVALVINTLFDWVMWPLFALRDWFREENGANDEGE